ncbi:hypothetical protein [Rhizobium hainanense]|nr:hypothetical protein [Rhizobium hainanense]
MNRVAAPPSAGHPDRFLKCQEAMEDALETVAASATSAGWSPEEVAAALVELADNHMLALLANSDLARDLAALKK